MKRRWIALIIAVVMGLSVLTGCASEPNEHEAGLLAEWQSCLDTYETMFHTVDWALEYARVYVRDNSWESLMNARAASVAALEALEVMELPGQRLSMEAYESLLADGIEADLVSLEWENLENSREQYLATLEQLVILLRDEVYLEHSFVSIQKWVDFTARSLELEGEYLCLGTNYLLLQTVDQSLWQTLPEKCPIIAANAPNWMESGDGIMERTGQVLDEIEAQMLLWPELLGTSDYTLELVRGAVESGDFAVLSEQIHEIEGVPGWFPMPSWLDAGRRWYYLVSNGGDDDFRLVEVGEKIPESACCYIACPGISLEQAQGYAARLEEWGLAPYTGWDDAGESWQMLVSSGESSLYLSWSGEDAVLYLTGPVGCLIPELYLLAMLEG